MGSSGLSSFKRKKDDQEFRGVEPIWLTALRCICVCSPYYEHLSSSNINAVGDCVLLTPEHGGNDYVGNFHLATVDANSWLLIPLLLVKQIGEIKWIGGRRPGGEHAVRIAWFYRPEEVLGGRKVGPTRCPSRFFR